MPKSNDPVCKGVDGGPGVTYDVNTSVRSAAEAPAQCPMACIGRIPVIAASPARRHLLKLPLLRGGAAAGRPVDVCAACVAGGCEVVVVVRELDAVDVAARVDSLQGEEGVVLVALDRVQVAVVVIGRIDVQAVGLVEHGEQLVAACHRLGEPLLVRVGGFAVEGNVLVIAHRAGSPAVEIEAAAGVAGDIIYFTV